MKGAHALTVLLAVLPIGCVSTADIDAGFRRLDRAWQLEYQQTEDRYRARVIDAPYAQVYDQVRKTLLDLKMPIQESDFESGLITSENEAPHPLTKEEWGHVVEVENPRVKEVGGWMFSLDEDAEGYVVTLSVSLHPMDGRTLVVLDYTLDMPELRTKGFHPSEHAPPLAVQLGSEKFWAQLRTNLEKVSLPGPRKRSPGEVIA